MEKQNTQRPFTHLVRTFLAKAREVSDIASQADTASVPLHPRAEVAASLLRVRMLSRRVGERMAEKDGLSKRVFRYSSSSPCAPLGVPPLSKGS